jgi:hypothetical protein
MPEKMKHNHNKRGNYYNRNNNFDVSNQAPTPQPFNQQTSMIQITNLAELAAFSGGFGGFNPNKYSLTMPMGYQGQQYFPPHMMYQQSMPFNPTAATPKQFKPQSSKGQRYEKKEKTSSPSTGAQKSGKKEKNPNEQKKYVTKQKKEEKNASTPVEGNAAQ